MSTTNKAARTQKPTIAAPSSLAVRAVIRRRKQPRCTATTRSGKPCEAPPARGTKRCLMHTGDNASVLGAKGGRRRAVYNPSNLEAFAAPKTVSDMRQLLASTIVETRSGRIDPKVANTIAYLGTAFMNACELADLEARLQALEAKQGGKAKLTVLNRS